MTKTTTALALLALAALSFGQYASNRVRMLSHIALADMPGAPSSGAGSTGYVSPGGREYGIMGVRTGTIFVDITNPQNAQLLSLVPGANSLWHENTVLGNYAYLVSDQTGSGVQIVDLTNIDTTHTIGSVTTYAGNSLTTVHTIQSNPQTNSLFLNGSNRGFLILDATNRTAPVEVARWTDRYVHDCVPANYTSGPYAGHEIVFACCGGNGLYILDVTNRSSIVTLGSVQYLASGGYCHSGMLTPDKHYFLINDEFDESNGVATGATTHVIDVSDPTHPVEATQFHNPIQVIDHNSAYQDGFMMLAAYRGGLRVYDPSNPLAISEKGFFDTYPGPDAYSYDGDWGLFAGFPSGNVVLSDINAGFFVVDPSEAKGWGAPITSLLGLNSTIKAKSLRRLDNDSMFLGAGTTAVNFRTTATSRASLVVSLAALQLTGGQVFVDLKNFTTGNFDAVLTPTLTGTMQTYSSPSLPGASYIDANGNVNARLRVVVPETGGRFQGAADLLRVDVN